MKVKLNLFQMNSHTIEILSQFTENTTIIDITNKNIVGILDLSKFTQLSKLDCSYNLITQLIDLPPSLKCLYCHNNNINRLIDIPTGLLLFKWHSNPVEELKYPLKTKIDFNLDLFENNLKKIILTPNYSDDLDFLQTTNITNLEFDYKLVCIKDNFSHPIDLLPSKLTFLKLGIIFNHPIDNLPLQLIHLEFHIMSEFNQPIDLLPIGLTFLKLGKLFNQPINNLPIHLKQLIFNENIKGLKYCEFSQPLTNLPNQLIYLSTGYSYDLPLDDLPDSLNRLILGFYFDQPIDNLPNNLTHLIFSYSGNFSHPLDNLPNKLMYLELNSWYSHPLTNLPNSLYYIRFNNNFNHLLDINKLPQCLKIIESHDKCIKEFLNYQNVPAHIEFRIGN